MNKLLATAGLVFGLCLSNVALAKAVTINATLKDYRGNGAYLAIYLTNADGKYAQTLWISGGKSKYYKHLSEWARGSSMQLSEYDGKTGASVSSGESLTVTVEISDAWIDTGYLIRVDSAVEDQRDNRIDAEVPLTSQGSGKSVSGRGYVNTLGYSM
jgi:hypothetical protein